MGTAILSGKRSKDPSTQVGACIVNPNKKIVGIGYNGATKGFSDDDFPWSRDGEPLETKYLYVVHAEKNAILNATKHLVDCTIYVTLFPCNDCAKAIIQSGITRVVYLSDKYAHLDSFKASRIMFEKANVALHKLEPDVKEITLSFEIE